MQIQTPSDLKLAQSIVSEKQKHFHQLPGFSLGSYQDFFNFFRLLKGITKEEVSIQKFQNAAERFSIHLLQMLRSFLL